MNTRAGPRRTNCCWPQVRALCGGGAGAVLGFPGPPPTRRRPEQAGAAVRGRIARLHSRGPADSASLCAQTSSSAPPALSHAAWRTSSLDGWGRCRSGTRRVRRWRGVVGAGRAGSARVDALSAQSSRRPTPTRIAQADWVKCPAITIAWTWTAWRSRACGASAAVAQMACDWWAAATQRFTCRLACSPAAGWPTLRSRRCKRPKKRSGGVGCYNLAVLWGARARLQVSSLHLLTSPLAPPPGLSPCPSAGAWPRRPCWRSSPLKRWWRRTRRSGPRCARCRRPPCVATHQPCPRPKRGITARVRL